MALNYGVTPSWAKTTDAGRTHIASKGVIQDGLVFNIDAGSSVTYPGSGTVLYDIQGNHNLNLNAGAVYTSTDRYGAILFDGVGDFANATNIPLASPVSLTNNFTLEQVFRPTGYQTSNYYGLTNMLFQKGTASTYNYASQVTSDTTVSFIKRTSPEGLQYVHFTVPSMLGKPNMVTFVVKNGDNGAIDTVDCYFNGVYSETKSIGGGLPIAAVNGEPLYLGGSGGTQYTGFIGAYYSCRIYNRALSSAEVNKNFRIVKDRFEIS